MRKYRAESRIDTRGASGVRDSNRRLSGSRQRAPRWTFTALPGLPEVGPAARLDLLIATALKRSRLQLRRGDILVVAQKVVSKAEDRFLAFPDIRPTARARELARLTGKDPRVVQAILAESTAVVRAVPGVLIVRHRLGLVMAQAGIDRSNLPAGERLLLLPEDPDASAGRLRRQLARRLGVAPGVIISDSFGRPWRLGTVNVAIGVAGLPALWDRRGELDRHGRVLEATVIAWADAVAAGAGLAMGEAAEGFPVVLARGPLPPVPAGAARDLLRPGKEDLFA